MKQDEIIQMARQAGCPMANMMPMYFTDTQLLVMLEAFAKLVAAKAFPDGVDAEWIARRTKYAVEQERANNALLCYQQRKHWDALACSDAIRAGTRARGEA
jgi:hypothetical protein